MLKDFATFLEEKLHEKEHFLQKNSNQFPVYSKVFSFSGGKTLERWSRLHFSCPKEHVSWKKLLMEKIDFFSKKELEEIFLKVLRKLFGRLVKIVFRCPRELLYKKRSLFWRKQFFPRLRSLTEGFSNFQTTTNCKFVHNCIWCIEMNDLIKISGFKKLEKLYHFRNLSGKSFAFLLNFFGTVVRSLLARPSYFSRINSFQKFTNFFGPFCFLSDFL